MVSKRFPKVSKMALDKISEEGIWISGISRGVLVKGVLMEEESLLGVGGMRFSGGVS